MNVNYIGDVTLENVSVLAVYRVTQKSDPTQSSKISKRPMEMLQTLICPLGIYTPFA